MARTGTTWKPGQSGNPGGRPKVAKVLRSDAQTDAPEAYAEIKRIMREGDKDASRLAAAVRVLQIAGVPMSEEKVTEPEKAEPTVPRNLTPEELEAAATKGEA